MTDLTKGGPSIEGDEGAVLTHLSDEAAQALAQNQGRLVLPGVSNTEPAQPSEIDQTADETAQAVQQSITTLDTQTAEALDKHRGELKLPGVGQATDK